ncbi:MAG: type III-B CRISPR module RAMP protein Cmr1 [Nitrososphaerales archaeon]
MSTWLLIQEKIAVRDWIAEIKLTNTTPVRIGGYNAKPFSNTLNLMEEPRTQSIKGLWRWWARAILAGAVLRSERSLAKSLGDINKDVSRLLGSINASSEFFIQTTFKLNGVSYIESRELENVPRVKLVTMGLTNDEKRRIERYYRSLSLRVVIGARKSIEEDNKDAAMFALSSLIISLIFSGIGSITTRGFGKLKIIDIEPRSPTLRNEVDNLGQLLKELYQQDSEQGITRKLKDLISVSLGYASDYMSLGRVATGIKISKIPLYSALLLDCDPEIFRLETICISRRNPQQILECLGKSTLKSEWKRKKHLPLKSSGKTLHTWVLGLPRYQEPFYEVDGKREKQLTGYILDNKKEKRRHSPIGFTILECSGGLALVIYGFLTSEFAEMLKGHNTLTLQHVGVHTTGSSLRGVIGKLTSIKRTNVYDDLRAHGVSFPDRSQQINNALSVDYVYKNSFDAAWDFVRQIIRDGCCR